MGEVVHRHYMNVRWEGGGMEEVEVGAEADTTMERSI